MASPESAVLGPPATSVFHGAPWEGVLRLLRRARTLDDLQAHRLQLLEAARLREAGEPVPPELADAAAGAQRGTLIARSLLARIRSLCDGPVLVLKGPEAELAYPAPGLRAYTDVDVLVPDADAVEARLRAAGFTGIGPEMDWDSLHHVQRLLSPDVPASVEVHRRPKWVAWLEAPSVDELLEAAAPSGTGIDGVLAPSPAHHAVLLAVHAWAERPLGRISDLVDVAALRRVAGSDADEVARAWGVERIWRSTLEAIEALLVEDRATWPLRTWARHLPRVRERTVLEHHLTRLLEPFAARPLGGALAGARAGLRTTLFPHRDERWREKLRRAARAVRSPRAPLSRHTRPRHEDERERS